MPRPRPFLSELTNLPNLITLGRVAAIPPFLWLLSRGDPKSSFWAAIVFALAAISDVVDGWLARRMNLVSVFGKLMDPLADKLIVTSGLVMLAQMGRVEAWLVIILLCRELIVSGLRQIASSEGLVIAASQGGKWKTALQLTGLIAVIVHFSTPVSYGVIPPVEMDWQVVGEWLLVLSLAPSVISAVQYFRGFWDAVGQRGAGDRPASQADLG